MKQSLSVSAVYLRAITQQYSTTETFLQHLPFTSDSVTKRVYGQIENKGTRGENDKVARCELFYGQISDVLLTIIQLFIARSLKKGPQ